LLTIDIVPDAVTTDGDTSVDDVKLGGAIGPINGVVDIVLVEVEGDAPFDSTTDVDVGDADDADIGDAETTDAASFAIGNDGGGVSVTMDDVTMECPVISSSINGIKLFCQKRGTAKRSDENLM
jgi:hypothetical protein